MVLRERLRRRSSAVMGASVVFVGAGVFALLWWLVPVSSAREPDCGSVRDPIDIAVGTGAFTLRPCDGAISDQTRLVRWSLTVAILAGSVLVAAVLVPERPHRPIPEEWPERTDEDILRA